MRAARRNNRLTFAHDDDLLLPAVVLCGTGAVTLWLFRVAIIQQRVRAVGEVLFVVGASLCLVVGVVLMARSFRRVVVDGERHRVVRALFLLPIEIRAFDELTAVAVDVCHDYLLDRTNDRPVIRRRRFKLRLTEKGGRTVFYLGEVNDYMRAMAIADQVAAMTGLPLREPIRVRCETIDDEAVDVR